jgi:hypothetical protein
MSDQGDAKNSKDVQIAFRVSPEVASDIQTEMERMVREMPGIRPTMGGAAKNLLMTGIALRKAPPAPAVVSPTTVASPVPLPAVPHVHEVEHEGPVVNESMLRERLKAMSGPGRAFASRQVQCEKLSAAMSKAGQVNPKNRKPYGVDAFRAWLGGANSWAAYPDRLAAIARWADKIGGT